jgi:hypothetical protein
MKHITTYIITSFLLLISINSLSAQRFGDGERGERIKALWVAFITQELDLSPDESAKFWPIYNEYMDKERALNKSKNKFGKLNPDELSEAEIDRYFNENLSIEEQLIALKRTYYKKLKTAIPAKKIIQLPQAEREFKKKIIQFLQARRENTNGGNPPRGNKRF